MIRAALGGRMARYAFAAILIVGILARVLVVALPGNELKPRWSGGGDTPAYVTLAQNLLVGKGYSYAGQPSAFRPPGYPVLLAAMMWLFHNHFAEAVRWLQFGLGLLAVSLCARAGARFFGSQASLAALAAALVLPTMVFVTGELLTESVGVFFTALFLYLLSEEFSRPRWATALGMGLTAGLASLFRFNMAVLAFVAVGAVLLANEKPPRWQRAAVVLLSSFLVVSPWLVRNFIVFHGRLAYSSQSGLVADFGVLAPQGRALPADVERLRRTPGWISHLDLETNDPKRNQLPGEDEINRRGWNLAFQLWREENWRLLPLALAKLAYFWLGIDQIFWTESFPPAQRLLRAAAVIPYWLVLLLAVKGWSSLCRSRKSVAQVLLGYAALFTILLLPFVMNTRMRVPLLDPLLAILAGGGWLASAASRFKEAPAAPIAATPTDVGA